MKERMSVTNTIEIIYQIKIDQKHEFKVLLILKRAFKNHKITYTIVK